MKKGWEIKKLGEVSEIVCGGTPDTKVSEYWDGEYLWVTPKDMGKLESLYVDDTERKISYAGLKNSSAKMLPPNSIILSTRAPIGHLAINIREIATNQGCKGIVPNKELSGLFLFYFLKNSIELLNNLGSGTTFKELSTTKLAEVTLPLPPLPEQLRIVAILDKAFAAIATAKANAEKNLRNTREVFESYLQSVFSNRGDGWEKKKLGEITTKIGSGATPLGGEKSYKTHGISSVRSMNTHNMGFRTKDLAFLDNNQADALSNVVVEPGDVLLNITGASVARCCVVPDGILPARVNQHVSIIRLVNSMMISGFLHYALISKEYKDRLLKIGEKGGSTRQALTKSQIEAFPIQFPSSIPEQRSIVAKLDALSSETKKLETIYQKKLADLDELKKSFLQKAFNGELTN